MSDASPQPTSARSESPFRRALTLGIFPVYMVCGVAAGYALLNAGIEPRLVNPLLAPFIFGSVQCLEWLHPYIPAWNRSHGDLRTDIGYFGVTSVTVFATMAALSYVMIPLGEQVALHAPWAIWPHAWPLPFQVLLALVIAELGHYWVHRLQHVIPFLWRFHAVHHSAPRLYWLNAGRFHPVDMALSTILGFTPLLLLGCNQVTLTYFMLIGAIHNLFQHANINVKLGPLNYVFSMAELHRWHHSRVLEEANANYGGHLAFWDLVFRTRYFPRDRLPPQDIGLAWPPTFPETLIAQLVSPFQGLRNTAIPPVPSDKK